MDHIPLSKDALLLVSIGELMTMGPLAKGQPTRGKITKSDLGLIHNAWLLIDQGKVKALGSGKPPSWTNGVQRIDAGGRLVTPGLIDCHTHPIFGGDRSQEFAQRLDGASYQDIAASGGGIRSSIAMSRASSDEQLAATCRQHLQRFLAHGVTTVEVKSGYGQSPEEELRHLRILNKLRQESRQTITVTCLGLHARPSEYPDGAQFIQDMTGRLLPAVAEEGLAEWVDAFVEEGYFSVADCEPYMQKARELGLKIRIHADEFQDSGAALAAGRWQARSADHLEEASSDGLRAMSQEGTVAVLLPGTSLYAQIPFVKADRIRHAGCLMAIATDFNPGSCQIDNLPLITSVGALHCGLHGAEALAAVTYVAALALDLSLQKGCLMPGYDGDFLIHQLRSTDHWLADFGRHAPSAVYICGKKEWPES